MTRIAPMILCLVFIFSCLASTLRAQEPVCCHTRTVELDTIEKIFSDWVNGPPPNGGFEHDIEETTDWPATRQELCDLISVPPSPPALTATLKVSLNVTLPDADPLFPNRIKDGDRIVATATFTNLGAGELTQYKMYLTLGPETLDSENYLAYDSGSTETLTFTEYFDFDAHTRVNNEGNYRLLEIRAWGDGELGPDDHVEIQGIYHCLIEEANPPGPITQVATLPPGCAKCGNQRPCTTAGASTVCPTPELIEHGTAVDYSVINVPGSLGCSSCSGAIGSLSNVPNSLIFERRMIPANQVTIGNSSPGMYFMDMDMRLDLYEGNSPGQNVAIFFDPNCERSVFMTDSGATGIYAPDTPGEAYVSDLTLYDGSGNVTADIDLAETAKITSHDGWVFVFDIVGIHIDCFHRGGCINTITSPDGFVKTFGYKTFSPTEIDDDPTLQYQVDSVTDPSGNTAEISYDPLQQAGRWVISDIDVNQGEVVLEYDYNASGHLETVKRNGVTISEYTYGEYTPWNAAFITWDHLLWNNAQARDTVYLSADYLIWEGELVNQFADNLVGRADGSGYDYMSVNQKPATPGVYRVEYRGQLIEWTVGQSWRYFESWTSTGEGGYDSYSGTLEDTANNMAFAHHYDPDPTNYVLGQPWQLVDETGYLVEVDYDSEGNMLTRNHGNDYEKWLYDNNQVKYYRDRAGFVTLTERDSRGLVVRVTKGHKDLDGDGISTAEPEAIQIIFGYYGSGDPKGGEGMLKWTATNAYAAGPVVEPAANTRTDYEYGDRNQLVKVTRPLPAGQTVRPTVEFEWVNGQVFTMTDEVDNITTYTYDAVDRVTKILYPDGSDDQTWYDDPNYQVYQKNRNDVVDLEIRDDVGRVSRMWGAMGTDSNILDNHIATVHSGVKRIRQDNYFLVGRVQPRKITQNGITSEIDYDYRGRANVARRYASKWNDVIVTNTKTFVDNMLFSSSQSYPGYSRTTYNGYSSDRFEVRRISTSNPTITYADNNAIIQETRVSGLDPDHVIVDGVRDLQGNLVQVIDGYGTITMNTFDSLSRPTQTVLGHGESLALTSLTEYNGEGRVERTTDPAGMETFVEYDDAGNVKTLTQGHDTPLALATSYTYDPRSRQKTVTSPSGAVSTSHYNDCCGHVAASEDTYGDGSIRVANSGGQTVYQAAVKDFDFDNGDFLDPPASETLSETTSRYYDAGQVHYTTRWKSARGTIDPQNPAIAGVDSVPVADGLTTQFVYFFNLRPNAAYTTQSITRLGGGSATIDMNPMLDQLKMTPANGGASLQFVASANSNSLAKATVAISPDEMTMQVAMTDGLGRPVMNALMTGPAATTPNELITWNCVQFDQSYTLTGFGDVERVNQIDRDGNMASILGDGFGSAIGSLDADDNLTRSKFDEGRNLRDWTDANGNSVTYVYDALGRNTSTTNFAGTTSTVYNNTTGRVDSRDDAKSNTTSFAYDILGRPTTVTDRLGENTVRVYDSAGRLSTLTDAQSKTTTYAYDLLGRKTSTTYPDGRVTTNDYDPSGTFPTGSRAAKVTFDSGKSKTAIASFDGTLDKIEYRDDPGTLTGTDDFSYDTLLRRSGSISMDGVVRAFAYNDNGQLDTDTTTYGGQSYTVTYGYDDHLRRDSITYPSGRVADYTFTNRNELDTISWDSTQIEDRLYDDGGRLTNVDRAYTDEVRTYDAANRVTSIDNTNVGTGSYTWDANNNKLSETWTGNMSDWSFTTEKSGAPQFADGYDEEDRFRRFIQSSQSSDIYLDRSDIGNVTDVNDGTAHLRSYSDVHELTSVDGTSQTFDDDGNLTLTHNGITINWDDANRLTQTVVPSTATAGIEGTNDYGYDSGGNRVFKKITRNSIVVEHTVFIYAGPNCIAEYASGTAASSPDQEYVYALSVDSLVLLSHDNDTDQYVTTRNQQWSITALVDVSDGTVQERYTYDHFGRRTILAADGSTVRTVSSYSMPYGYTSRRHDIESDLMYFRARYFDPTTGEFTSADPLGYIDGMSLYRGYMMPNGMDPMGTFLLLEDPPWPRVKVETHYSCRIYVVRSCIVCHNPHVMSGGSISDLPIPWQRGAGLWVGSMDPDDIDSYCQNQRIGRICPMVIDYVCDQETVNICGSAVSGHLNWLSGFTPIVNDIRDVIEVIIGKDLFTGRKFSAQERRECLQFAMLPVGSRKGAEVVEDCAEILQDCAGVARRAPKRVSGKNPPITSRQALHTNGTPGKSQFKPGIDVECVVRNAWERGRPVFDKNGKFIGKRATFDSPIGTSPSGHDQISIMVHWSPTRGIHGVPTTVQ